MQQKQRRFLKVGGITIMTVFALFVLAAGVSYARAGSTTPRLDLPLASVANGPLQLADTLIVEGDNTISYEDLTVQSGEIYDNDIIVYSGDVVVEQDGQVHGSLVVYSGDVTIAEGGTVDGDVIAMSGDARIAGQIGGAVVVWSGDITLEGAAIISGDVSVMSGDIERQSGATVAGNVIVGPKFPKLPPILTELGLPNLPGQSTIVEAAPPTLNPNGWSRVSVLLLRLIGSLFLTALVVLITGLVYYLQPALVERLRATITVQKPTNFVIGLLLNIVLTMLVMLAFSSGSMVIALCLAPLSLVATFLFLLLNTGGWAALSLIVGERLLSYTKFPPHAFTALLIGATAMTGTITFVWALGGCMRPVAYIAMLTLTALGGGTLIVQQFQGKRSASL
jgi:cytoskeletal protein CcmA (bactofilin family)